jgi:hypothetical protein
MPRKTKQTKNIDADKDVNDIDNLPKSSHTNKSRKSLKDYEKDDEAIDARQSEVLEMHDSSEISDIDENQDIPDAFEAYDDEGKQADNGAEFTDEYINTVVADRVIKYLKLDDLMKEKQVEHKKEIKTIKDAKEQLEQFLISYLDKVNEEYIQLGGKSTLTKVEKESIAPPKMEDVSVCLMEGFRRHEIYEDDDKIKQVVEDFMKEIEIKRERKVRKYLKRSGGEKDKKKKNDAESETKKQTTRKTKKTDNISSNNVKRSHKQIKKA